LTRVGGQDAVELETERLALVVDVPGVRVARDLETNRLLRLWFFFWTFFVGEEKTRKAEGANE
jgi:hypothetical protein